MEKIESTTSRCYVSPNDEEFVGFEKDVKQIIQKLTSGTKEREVISIVGMAGLGKTTLARKVYNDHYIADRFNARAFCVVSQKYSIRKLLFDILKQAMGEKRDMIREDEDVAVSDLLKLWIAEELVPNINDTENLEKSSKDCLSDLVNRSLLMVSKRRSNGDIKYCMVHDLIREFCSSKLEEEDFKQRVVSYNSSQVPSYTKDPARLCMYIHDNLVNQLELHGYSLDVISMVDSEEKESLEFIAHPRFYSTKCMDLFSLLDNLKLIRVLHLLDINMESTWEFQISPASTLEKLTHLKYLAIFVKKFDFKWVSHMIGLQTLRVHSHQRIKTSPDIWKMKKLRHVDITEFSFIWEDDEQEQHVLDNLKTFGKCRVSLADMNRKFWWRFPNLEELSLSVVNFHGMPNHSLFPTPEIHNRLQSLEISFPIGFSTSIGWFKSVFPMNVRFLSLSGISLTEEVVTSIAALQKLETLKLFFIHFPNNNLRWDVTDREFKVLKYFKLELVDMNQWESSDTSFPMLEKLVIKDCEQLEEIPSSFVDIPTLRLLKLINCSESVCDSAQSIKEEVENTQGCERLSYPQELLKMVSDFIIVKYIPSTENYIVCTRPKLFLHILAPYTLFGWLFSFVS